MPGYLENKVRAHVGRVAVVNPQQFKVISQSVKKTDTNDAKTPAKFLAKDMLPEVRMKDDANAQCTRSKPMPTV